MNFQTIIIYLGYFILAINTLIYLKSYRKNTIAFKIISFYLLFSLILQLRVEYLKIGKEHNLFLSHFYFIGQFILLSLLYKNLLKKKLHKLILKITFVIILLVLSIQYYRNPALYDRFNLLEIVICSIPLIFYAFLYFILNIDSGKKDFIYLNSGVFIYLLSSTLLFVAGNYVSSSVSFWNRFIWSFNAFLYLIYQILIFVDWYKNFRPKKISSIFVNNE
ncbi:hypothetical protein [Polaribacter sp. Hel1_85]|uniref:hypothetical protein n=1 Tax=Polaribacter sp. Hel1_85 TaxID=1250005 RepID=UPI00052BDDFF|nr:hypothetical protein [Polaribacter sp. Hel1_85]KGL61987.1 conserved hypothetical membrane protein [Polaribacter sp. Hel1_85]